MLRPPMLLIDDEPQLAAFVAKAGEMCGYAPRIADGDDDFRHQFVTHHPALVALDLGMPGSDGVELLRFLAEQGFAGPVLIISGGMDPVTGPDWSAEVAAHLPNSQQCADLVCRIGSRDVGTICCQRSS